MYILLRVIITRAIRLYPNSPMLASLQLTYIVSLCSLGGTVDIYPRFLRLIGQLSADCAAFVIALNIIIIHSVDDTFNRHNQQPPSC
eukprot:2620838-Pyramimonas_sp.AAC.1